MLYVPYISESFKKEYIIPYYIGETLFGVIPSFLAIVQGVGDESTCHNVTQQDNSTVLEPLPLSPLFSVSFYFRIIFGFLALSTLAFVLINCLDLDSHRRSNSNDSIKDEDSRDKLLKNSHEVKQSETPKLTNKEKLILFGLNFFITFFYYGILPGIQSYSTMPYG